MLGTTESTKFKPHPLLKSASDVSLIFTVIFIVLTTALYFYYPEHRAASLISSLFIVIFQFPRVLYWVEIARMDNLRKELRASKSSSQG